MYEVFDNFLNVSTWHTNHDADLRRFYQALNRIVRQEAFNADQMAAYLCEKVGVSLSDSSGYSHAIARLQDKAWAVREFLTMTYATTRFTAFFHWSDAEPLGGPGPKLLHAQDIGSAQREVDAIKEGFSIAPKGVRIFDIFGNPVFQQVTF